MARVILDVPSEKMGSFVRMIMQLGIDKHSIGSDNDSAPARQKENFSDKLRSFTSRILDWDRNRNELEFE